MPSTPSYLNTGGVGGGGSFAIASSSPTANAELYVLIAWSQTSGSVNLGATPVSSAFSITGSWTEVVAPTTAVGTSNVRLAAYRARASGSPGSGTVTVTFASGVTIGRGYLVEVASDYDETTPVRQSDVATDASSGTTISGTFDSAPLSDSVLIGIAAGAAAGGANTTESSGWTELNQQTNSLSSNAQRAAGSNGSAYGGTFNITRDGGMAALALEIQGPVAPALDPIRMRWRAV